MVDQALPVAIQTMVIKQNGTEIYYPQLYGLQDQQVEQKMNADIFQAMQQLVQQQFKQQGASEFAQMIGTFEIKTNERNVLSLTLTNYAIANHYAHGLTLMKSLTFAIQTGKNYLLQDLFKANSNYVEVLSNIIQKQIKERNIPVLDEFSAISPNQSFYIADKVLVIYFQAYEITPGYVGLPMFPISVYKLENIVREDGPLGRMMA